VKQRPPTKAELSDVRKNFLMQSLPRMHLTPSPYLEYCPLFKRQDEGLLKCLLCNARSIVNKLDCINVVIQTYCPDLVMFTETWLDSAFPDSMLTAFNNYGCYRKDRNGIGGGIRIMARPGISLAPVVLPTKLSGLEIVAVDLLK
jgi:hypothetical protein